MKRLLLIVALLFVARAASAQSSPKWVKIPHKWSMTDMQSAQNPLTQWSRPPTAAPHPSIVQNTSRRWPLGWTSAGMGKYFLLPKERMEIPLYAWTIPNTDDVMVAFNLGDHGTCGTAQHQIWGSIGTGPVTFLVDGNPVAISLYCDDDRTEDAMPVNQMQFKMMLLRGGVMSVTLNDGTVLNYQTDGFGGVFNALQNAYVSWPTY